MSDDASDASQKRDLTTDDLAKIAAVRSEHVAATDEHEHTSNATERILPCHCGALYSVRLIGGQNPDTLEWRFHAACSGCRDCERGAHKTLDSAVAAWNGIVTRRTNT